MGVAVKRRLIAGMGAGTFGLGISICIQLLSLPLFLNHWDVSTYGAWLVLSAIPAYLSMADVGMVTAAGNKMTMAMGRGDVAQANQVFQSAQLFMVLVCGTIGLLVIPAALWLPLPGLSQMGDRVALGALAISVLVSLFGGLTETVFRSTNRFATGTLVGSGVRLAEWVGSMVGLLVFGSFTAVGLGGLLARLIGTLASMYLCKGGSLGLHWGVTRARKSELFEMAKPAMAFMAFPLANALSFQGVTLLVAAMFGTTAVAIFSTYRTIARLAVQLTGVFGSAVAPEFSRLFGQNNMAALKRLWWRSAKLGLAQAIGLSLVIYIASPLLLKLWTRGNIEFIPTLMALMLLYAAIGGAWHVPRALLSAINRPTELARWSIYIGFSVVALAWLFGQYWHLHGVALAMLLAEALLAVVALRLVHGTLLKEV